MTHWRGLAVAVGLGIAALGAGTPAQAPGLQALKSIEPGQWQLRSRGDSTGGRLVCIADPAAFVQLRHPGLACERFVIADEPRNATVQYTCRGAGYGRTMVSVETPRLVQLTTQGVEKAGPFDESFEARKTGACPR